MLKFSDFLKMFRDIIEVIIELDEVSKVEGDIKSLSSSKSLRAPLAKRRLY
jgi:hypothetical protein